MDSILNSIKELLGIQEEDKNFDTDIIFHINTAIATLRQMGVGPQEGFSIEDDSVEWTDYIEDLTLLEAIKSYMFMKVKMMFDPPVGSVGEAYKENIKELEWRLSVQVDPGMEDI